MALEFSGHGSERILCNLGHPRQTTRHLRFWVDLVLEALGDVSAFLFCFCFFPLGPQRSNSQCNEIHFILRSRGSNGSPKMAPAKKVYGKDQHLRFAPADYILLSPTHIKCWVGLKSGFSLESLRGHEPSARQNSLGIPSTPL